MSRVADTLLTLAASENIGTGKFLKLFIVIPLPFGFVLAWNRTPAGSGLMALIYAGLVIAGLVSVLELL